LTRGGLSYGGRTQKVCDEWLFVYGPCGRKILLCILRGSQEFNQVILRLRSPRVRGPEALASTVPENDAAQPEKFHLFMALALFYASMKLHQNWFKPAQLTG
jgi:hypothetical protein